MTPAHFAAAWGAEALQRPSPAGIAAAGLFPESARFLSQAGLPATADPGFTFSFPHGAMASLADLALPPGGPKDKDWRPYRRLGGSAWMHVCLVREGEGEPIMQVVLNREPVIRFLNSSVSQLAECLLAYRDVMSAALAAEAEATRLAIAAAVRFSTQAPADRSPLALPAPDPNAGKRVEEAEQAEALRRLQVLRRQIARIDAPALAAGACWGQTLASRIELGGLSEA